MNLGETVFHCVVCFFFFFRFHIFVLAYGICFPFPTSLFLKELFPETCSHIRKCGGVQGKSRGLWSATKTQDAFATVTRYIILFSVFLAAYRLLGLTFICPNGTEMRVGKHPDQPSPCKWWQIPRASRHPRDPTHPASVFSREKKWK